MFKPSEKFTAEVIRHARRALEPKTAGTLAALTGELYSTGKAAMNAATEIMDAEVAAGRAGVRVINGQTRYLGYNR